MQYPIDINSGTASRLKAFAELVLSLMKETDQLNATDFIEFTYTQSGLKLSKVEVFLKKKYQDKKNYSYR